MRLTDDEYSGSAYSRAFVRQQTHQPTLIDATQNLKWMDCEGKTAPFGMEKPWQLSKLNVSGWSYSNYLARACAPACAELGILWPLNVLQ